MHLISKNGQGVALCFALAVPSYFLGTLFPVIGGPVFAILLGMVLHYRIGETSIFSTGIRFTSKKILQYAVILLGFGMNLTDILEKGRESLPIILSTISTSLVLAFVLCKALKLPSKISILIGVGSSICGGSAIAATAPIIDAEHEEIAQSISVIFLFNLIAALIFPALGAFLGLSNDGFGLFAGTAINDTSSVTAAAAAWDGIHHSNTLQAATIVKLTRTLAIIPITLALSVFQTYQARKSDAKETSFQLTKVFPTFILFFLLAALLTTLGHLPSTITAPLHTCSKFFIVMAMSSIGLQTDVIRLFKTGGKPLFLGACCWVGIACMSLAMQHLLHLL